MIISNPRPKSRKLTKYLGTYPLWEVAIVARQKDCSIKGTDMPWATLRQVIVTGMFFILVRVALMSWQCSFSHHKSDKLFLPSRQIKVTPFNREHAATHLSRNFRSQINHENNFGFFFDFYPTFFDQAWALAPPNTVLRCNDHGIGTRQICHSIGHGIHRNPCCSRYAGGAPNWLGRNATSSFGPFSWQEIPYYIR